MLRLIHHPCGGTKLLLLLLFCPPPRSSTCQAENPTPSSVGLDDDSVIDRMTAELQQATKGLAPGFKLTPVQFEKVRGAPGRLRLHHCVHGPALHQRSCTFCMGTEGGLHDVFGDPG